ncbi:hypothetical protein BC941DRAFT_468261 [Chlamydoabsidia padenii]|nr:hypothetical protein BC941DRAFT_468261 [Chlamydoabsidia padenii]
MPLPSIRFPTKKQRKRRHSAYSHHGVDQCDILSRPLLPLDLRISSPTELINLTGHPRLALEASNTMKPATTTTTTTTTTRLDDSMSPLTPIPSTATDKTLLDLPPLKTFPSERSYNEEHHQAPMVIQGGDRRKGRPKSSSSPTNPRSELDRLWKQYDQEQSAWRQRLDAYRRREEELMNLLETTRAKLGQLEESLSDRATQYHHHHHHHHYYIHQPRRSSSNNKKQHQDFWIPPAYQL